MESDQVCNAHDAEFTEREHLASTVKPYSTTLRVASYNLLADCYVRVPEQPWNAFLSVSDEDINWSSRRSKISEELLRADADIICLQEVMFEEIDGVWALPAWLYSELLIQHGYVGVMQGLPQKEISKNAERNLRQVGRRIPTGVATFYRRDKFAIAGEPKSGSGSGLTLFLHPTEENQHLLICINNIHLSGSPSKFDLHEKQLASTLKHFSTSSFSDRMEIICGDFNCDITSSEAGAVSNWFSTNSFQRVHLGASWAGSDSISRLDHIMYRVSPTVAVSTLSWWPIDDSSALGSLPNGLPNEKYPSDHLLVSASFDINNQSSI
jgi:mRNA deadenylase 3'-5' endonuclease subunit Ccr4